MNMNIKLTAILSFLTTALACHPGWVSNAGSCYLFATINLDFLSAKDYCLGLSANMVHVNDASENDFLKKTVRSYDTKSWWIGLSDLDQETVFQWTDDNSVPTFTDWYPGQPNDFRHNEDCATMYKGYNYSWGDYFCTTQASHPICEKPDTPAV